MFQGIIKDVMSKEIGKVLTRKVLKEKKDESIGGLSWNFPRWYYCPLYIQTIYVLQLQQQKSTIRKSVTYSS